MRWDQLERIIRAEPLKRDLSNYYPERYFQDPYQVAVADRLLNGKVAPERSGCVVARERPVCPRPRRLIEPRKADRL